jgi:hypothetical protein
VRPWEWIEKGLVDAQKEMVVEEQKDLQVDCLVLVDLLIESGVQGQCDSIFPVWHVVTRSASKAVQR